MSRMQDTSFCQLASEPAKAGRVACDMPCWDTTLETSFDESSLPPFIVVWARLRNRVVGPVGAANTRTGGGGTGMASVRISIGAAAADVVAVTAATAVRTTRIRIRRDKALRAPAPAEGPRPHPVAKRRRLHAS